MDFALTVEQQLFRDEVARFAETVLADDVLARDADETFSRPLWRACADFGIQGLAVPTEYGGAGADALTTMLALEALGYRCKDNGLLFSLNAQMWACQLPIVRFGTEEQRRRYLPGLCDGSLIAAHGMTEAESGSDAFALTTRATQQGNDFVLDGSKVFVTNAPVADVFVVFASTDLARGFTSVSAFLVERDTPGLTIGQPLRKMGLRTSPMSELSLSGCRVPVANRLGRSGAGLAVFNVAMEWERSFILACTVGTMQRQLEQCLRYARERRQFGKPIAKFQAIAHKLVDMKVRVETARLLLYRLGWLMDAGRPSRLESALTKLYLSECFVQSSLDALQIHGGYGYAVEYELERDVRDAIGSRIYSGTSEMQRNIVAHALDL